MSAIYDMPSMRVQGIAGGLKVVHATGIAHNSGSRVDDVIVEVDGRAVADQQGFWDAMEAADWKPTLGGGVPDSGSRSGWQHG